MAIRKINPTSPGQRGMTKSDYQEITCTTPEKSLLKSLKKTAGRNNTGRIICRHKVPIVAIHSFLTILISDDGSLIVT